MDPKKNPFAAPRSFSKPSLISDNHLTPTPIDFERFSAIGNGSCAGMLQAAADNAASLRRLRGAASLSPDAAVPGNKRVAHSSDQTLAPESKRPRKQQRNGSQPPYSGPLFVKSSDGPYLVFDRDAEGEDINMQEYKVMRLARTDSETTYVCRTGELKGAVLKNEPLEKDQNRDPKDEVTKECSFYYKLDQEQVSQCIDWRRKLGSWLADILGKANNGERYILGAFPDGYEMWEHVHGVWVLPNAPNTPIDPRISGLNGDGVVQDNAAAPAAHDDDQDNEFLVVDSPLDLADGDHHIKSEVDTEDDASRRTAACRDSAYNSSSPTPAPALGGNRTLVKIHTGQRASDLLPRDQQPFFSKRRDDLYVYGYKNNKRYAAPNELFPHILWLATAPVGRDGKTEFPCTCHHCDPALDKERKANKIDRIDLAYKKWKEHTENLKVVR